MLGLLCGDYIFPVDIQIDDVFGDTEIFIGNPKCKPSPCIHISVTKDQKKAVLQDLVFFTTCSISEKLKKGDGSLVLMVKCSLKWLFDKYPELKRIEFMDKSYFESKDGKIMLPEKMVVKEGMTWYQKHFGAKPLTEQAKLAYNKYKSLYNANITLDNSLFLYQNMGKLVQMYPMLKNQTISSSTWYISRKVIYGYPDVYSETNFGGAITDMKRKCAKYKSQLLLKVSS